MKTGWLLGCNQGENDKDVFYGDMVSLENKSMCMC